MSAPVYTAITILRTALTQALGALTTQQVRWVEPLPDDLLPYVIAQSQDNGGAALNYVDEVAWSGLVTVKALATSLPAAEQLMNTVTPAMDVLSHAGVAISSKYQRPLSLPSSDGVYQAGHIWRVTISAA